MADYDYQFTVSDTNYSKDQSLTMPLGKSLEIKGVYFSWYYYGLWTDSSSPSSSPIPGCKFSSQTTHIYYLSGTPTESGEYSMQMGYRNTNYGYEGKGKYLTVYVTTTWYQNVFYNANGGSGAPSSQQWTTTAATQPSATSRTLSSTSPSRSNYTFKGWSTSSSASSASYSPGGSISPSYSLSSTTGTTLYAVWWGNWYAYLKYNANGGSGAPSQQSASKTQYSKPSANTFTISSTQPTKTNAVFKGWATTSTAQNPAYLPGDTISVNYAIGGNTQTLYAVYWTNWYSILKYDANGGTGAPATQSVDHTQYNKPSAEVHTISSDVPTRAGFTFKGWATSSTATTPSYQPGDTISVAYVAGSAGGTTLYAVWEEQSATMKVNVGGVWKDGKAFANVGGVWKEAKNVWVKVGGVWKKNA